MSSDNVTIPVSHPVKRNGKEKRFFFFSFSMLLFAVFQLRKNTLAVGVKLY